MAISVVKKHTYRTNESVTDPKDSAIVGATLTAASAADGGWFEVVVTGAGAIDLTTVDDVAITLTVDISQLPYHVPFKVKTVAVTSVATYLAVR